MASSSETDSQDLENLGELFNKGLKIYNELDSTDEPSNTDSFQIKLKEAIKIFENATRLVSYFGVFSRNEGVSEIATNDLQYFLLPALLGRLTIKLTTGERKEIIEVAEIYFKDFLERCHDYELIDEQFSKKNDSEQTNAKTEIEKLIAASKIRENKIQKFKRQKDIKNKLENLKKNVENEHVDEDIKREYFITMIKSFILEILDELNSIETEKPILEYMSKTKGKVEKEVNRAPPPKLRPIIITKDEIQKAVFGAGYPSLPTMTVDEFYEKRIRDGVFPDPDKKPTNANMSMQQAALAGVPLADEDREAEEKENKVETDDAETLERMRQMDEFKDEHRRGWGNRMNRS